MIVYDFYEHELELFACSNGSTGVSVLIKSSVENGTNLRHFPRVDESKNNTKQE